MSSSPSPSANQKPLDIELVRDLLFEDTGFRLAGFGSIVLSGSGTIEINDGRVAFNNGLVGIVPRMFIYGPALIKQVGAR